MLTSETFDAFISYSHHDLSWVRDWLLPRLESASVRVCIDFRDFDVGVPSLTNMEVAVERSRKTVLVLSPNWVASEWTKFESLLTQTDDPAGVRQRTLPLLLEKCTPPRRLGMFTHADFTDKTQWEAQLGRVIKAISGNPTAQAISLTTSQEAPASQASRLQPNLVHPYPLQANFTGRVTEREALNQWLANDEHPICELVAIGGMGKSALTWYWMKHDVLASPGIKLDGVMWWSFQDVESSFAKFVDDALRYVGGQPIDVQKLPSTYDRAQELRQQLQTKRILFVLDAFERQLRSYALETTHQADNADNTSREARACVDPNAARLLPYLASGPTGAKVLLTSRLMASNLEDAAGDPLVGVLQLDLRGLPRDDAVRFMRDQGVKKGTDTEIASVCDEYANHPLSLRLLSGLIEHDMQLPGDIAAAPRVAGRADFVAVQRQILEQSYDALPEMERELLSRIAAFRNPVTYQALAVFNDQADDEKFEAALLDLQARGLLQRDKAHGRFDLHPIVRRYSYERLLNKEEVHNRLCLYFATIPAPSDDEIHRLEDLAPLIELYHHTVRAGRYAEAANLYFQQLWKRLYYRLGAYQTQIELLSILLPPGDSGPPRLVDDRARAWALNEIASAFGLSGQPRRAVSLIEQHNSIREMTGDKRNLAVGLQNQALRQTVLGEIAAAKANVRRSVDLCKEIGDEPWESVAHQELGRILAYSGEPNEANAELQKGQDVMDKVGVTGTNYVSVVRACRALSYLLAGNPDGAWDLAKEARTLADAHYVEADIIWAEWLLAAAAVMGGKAPEISASHLSEALTRCRRINLVEIEPDILLTWAQWHRANGSLPEARSYADEALTIADRCEYRLKQADIHNFLARLALETGDPGQARKHAEIAMERATCDGQPDSYQPAFVEATAILNQLGITNGD